MGGVWPGTIQSGPAASTIASCPNPLPIGFWCCTRWKLFTSLKEKIKKEKKLSEKSKLSSTHNKISPYSTKKEGKQREREREREGERSNVKKTS